MFKKLRLELSKKNENLARIADTLGEMSQKLSYIETDFTHLINRGKLINDDVKTGLSSICKNVYNQNIRTDKMTELLEDIKALFPEAKIE